MGLAMGRRDSRNQFGHHYHLQSCLVFLWNVDATEWRLSKTPLLQSRKCERVNPKERNGFKQLTSSHKCEICIDNGTSFDCIGCNRLSHSTHTLLITFNYHWNRRFNSNYNGKCVAIIKIQQIWNKWSWCFFSLLLIHQSVQEVSVCCVCCFCLYEYWLPIIFRTMLPMSDYVYITTMCASENVTVFHSNLRLDGVWNGPLVLSLFLASFFCSYGYI